MTSNPATERLIRARQKKAAKDAGPSAIRVTCKTLKRIDFKVIYNTYLH